VLISNDDAAIQRYNVTFDGKYDPATSPFIAHVIAGFLLPPSLAAPPPVRTCIWSLRMLPGFVRGFPGRVAYLLTHPLSRQVVADAEGLFTAPSYTESTSVDASSTSDCRAMMAALGIDTTFKTMVRRWGGGFGLSQPAENQPTIAPLLSSSNTVLPHEHGREEPRTQPSLQVCTCAVWPGHSGLPKTWMAPTCFCNVLVPPPYSTTAAMIASAANPTSAYRELLTRVRSTHCCLAQSSTAFVANPHATPSTVPNLHTTDVPLYGCFRLGPDVHRAPIVAH
jgi:hypothetical protein